MTPRKAVCWTWGGGGGGGFSQFLKWDCGLLASQNPLGQLQNLERGNKAYKCPEILLDIFCFQDPHRLFCLLLFPVIWWRMLQKLKQNVHFEQTLLLLLASFFFSFLKFILFYDAPFILSVWKFAPYWLVSKQIKQHRAFASLSNCPFQGATWHPTDSFCNWLFVFQSHVCINWSGVFFTTDVMRTRKHAHMHARTHARLHTKLLTGQISERPVWQASMQHQGRSSWFLFASHSREREFM